MSRRNIAAILAGGSGRRMGGEKPKQLLELAGRTVLERSVDAFDTHPDIDEVIIVSHPDYLTELTEMAARNGWKKVTHIVPGGAERYDSSLAAMQTVTDADANLLIHDAARPLVSAQVIRRVVTALQEAPASSQRPSVPSFAVCRPPKAFISKPCAPLIAGPWPTRISRPLMIVAWSSTICLKSPLYGWKAKNGTAN